MCVCVCFSNSRGHFESVFCINVIRSCSLARHISTVICIAFINSPPEKTTSTVYIVHSNQRIWCSQMVEGASRNFDWGNIAGIFSVWERLTKSDDSIVISLISLLIVERLPVTAYGTTNIYRTRYCNPINFALIITRCLCVCSFSFDYISPYRETIHNALAYSSRSLNFTAQKSSRHMQTYIIHCLAAQVCIQVKSKSKV